MALGAKKIFSSDYSIATTGNAGPSKGQSNAEIGTVFIAVATPLKVYSQKFTFGDKRQRVLIKTLNMALTMIQKEIFKND
jgi:nicotinamide-nucleotide amidase